jgi:2-polyprenyl-3-methyl-5-hydroxy-6-metoxy-1,4-benzoquinol methylase
MEKKEDFLVAHYRALKDLRTDFRNYNLFVLVASLVKGHTVVDIGCGSGFFAQMLITEGKQVTGIEPSNEMRELAKTIHPQFTVVAGGAEDVSRLVTEPVETITMLDVLEHVENDSEQVQKIYGALQSTGEFVLVVPAHPILFGTRDIGMHHYRRYSKKTLRKVLTENGFHIVSMRHWNALGFLPYFISEKIFHRPLRVAVRGGEKKGLFSRGMRSALHAWFSVIENNFDFRFGLSIIAVARKL